MKAIALNPARRRFLHASGCIGLLSLMPVTAIAAPATPAMNTLEAINQAGRQRMLSQRMAKLYAQHIREVRQQDANKLLLASMALFEKQLANLHGFAQQKSAAEIVATYDQLGSRWQEYKQVVSTPPTREGLQKVAALNEQVLVSAHTGTVQLEKLHGGALGKLVNMSGRQRMLSQRMSKFYFFRRDGLTAPEMSKGLDTARTEFLTAMKILKNAPENTPDINTWIALGESQWVFFADALAATSSDRAELSYHDNNVAVTSENILQIMDKLTNLYAALS